MTRKKSKVWRKELNQLRAMSDVPWPARRFRTAPTTGRPLMTDRRCTRQFGIRRNRRPGWRGVIDLVLFRKPIERPVLCGAPLMLVPFDGRRRGHLICPNCTPLQNEVKKLTRQLRRGRPVVSRHA